MKKFVFLILIVFVFNSALAAKDSSKVEPKNPPPEKKYSLDVTVRDIPKGQQTLFIPIMIDAMVLDFDKVALEDLSSQNILAVASTSMDKVGTGIGVIKLDENGLPETLSLKVLLKPQGNGQTTVSLLMFADEAVLPSKGAELYNDATVIVKSNKDVEVTEKSEGAKKKLLLSEHKLTLDIKRPAQKEESIFIPIIFDKNVLDLDETFGHAIVAPGVSAKSFSSSSLTEGGPGVEILLSEVADKDFSIDVDLVPKKIGKTRVVPAFPQKGHTTIVSGPVVDINPATISVVSK